MRKGLKVLSVMLALVVISSVLAWALWNDSSVGCGPEPLPHWTPISVQIALEVRCGS